MRNRLQNQCHLDVALLSYLEIEWLARLRGKCHFGVALAVVQVLVGVALAAVRVLAAVARLLPFRRLLLAAHNRYPARFAEQEEEEL
jgi:hypothetical protein